MTCDCDNGIAIVDDTVYRCWCPKGDAVADWFSPSDKKKERPVRLKQLAKPKVAPTSGRELAAGEKE